MSVKSTIQYSAIIGLEVHVQLKTKSKMFCSCVVDYGSAPNTHICPICLGLPGALPVINQEALRLTARTGLMLGCKIPEISKFDRKNYYYPDIPKNYQISQYDQPLCLGGNVILHESAYPKDAQKSISTTDKIIRLTRIHLEEDVAKSFHLEDVSVIDFNRAGTPLMEIVSEADITSPEEAFAYLTVLRQLLIYGKISDAYMEKGQLRCDVNVSIRRIDEEAYGTKIEIKNLNTISGVRRALAFEIKRQIELMNHGVKFGQETRRWDDDRGETTLIRIKESSHDYRYCPDPDLLPFHTCNFVNSAKVDMPELPQAKRDRFVTDFGISVYDATVIASDLALADYFEEAVKNASKPKSVANWIINDLLSALAAESRDFSSCPIQAVFIGELITLIEQGTISGRQGKEVFAEMMLSGKSPSMIVQEKGLQQVSDFSLIEAFCDQVISDNPASVADYKSGKKGALNFLQGQVMKISKGKANPVRAGAILAEKLT